MSQQSGRGGLAATPAPASPPHAAAPTHDTNSHAAAPPHDTALLLDLSSSCLHTNSTTKSNEGILLSQRHAINLQTRVASPFPEISLNRRSPESSNQSRLHVDNICSPHNYSDSVIPELLNLSGNCHYPGGLNSSPVNTPPKVVSLDIGAGLTTIDTSGLSAMDSAQNVTPDPVPATCSRASRVVTAQGTIVPPLASNVLESASASRHSLEDPPKSPAHPRHRNSNNNINSSCSGSRSNNNSCSRPSSQLCQYTLGSSFPPAPTDLSSQHNKCSSNGSTDDITSSSPTMPFNTFLRHPVVKSNLSSVDLKSPFTQGESKSPVNGCDFKSSPGVDSRYSPNHPDFKVSNSCDVKFPGCSVDGRSPTSLGSDMGGTCLTPTYGGSDMRGLTPGRSSSSCPQSPASSPPVPVSPCSPRSPMLGAGCEVRGMPATPVSVAAESRRTCHPPPGMAVDNCDGGRLTFFKGNLSKSVLKNYI